MGRLGRHHRGVPAMTIFLAQLIPVNPGSVDSVSYVTAALDALVSATSGLFLPNARSLLDKLGLLALVLGAMSWTWGYLTGHHIFSGDHFWRVLVRYLIAYNLLRYFNSPMPLVGYSFHQIFTEEGRWLAAQIDISILNTFLQQIATIWGGTEKPHYWDIPATLIYVWTAIDLTAIEIGLFAVTVYSFWAIGVGLILGPFFIVAYLFRATSHFFWAWVNYMVKYCLYRVVASALVAVMATALLRFMSSTLHGDYSIGHWWAILPGFTVMIAGGLLMCLKVGQLVNDLTSGGAYAGTGGIPIPVVRRFV
jgi:TrbL/VirB6 plasmid conjugal transfer protein